MEFIRSLPDDSIAGASALVAASTAAASSLAAAVLVPNLTPCVRLPKDPISRDNFAIRAKAFAISSRTFYEFILNSPSYENYSANRVSIHIALAASEAASLAAVLANS